MFLIVFELVAVVTVILSDAFKFCVNAICTCGEVNNI